jgi:flagellar hook-length control protein FliK
MDLAKSITQIPQALSVPINVSAMTSLDTESFDGGGFSDVLRDSMSARHSSERDRSERDRSERVVSHPVERDAVKPQSPRRDDSREAVDSKNERVAAQKMSVQDRAVNDRAVNDREVKDRAVKECVNEGDASEADTQEIAQDSSNQADNVSGATSTAASASLESPAATVERDLSGMLASVVEAKSVDAKVSDTDVSTLEVRALDGSVGEGNQLAAATDDSLLSGSVFMPGWIEKSITVVSQATNLEAVGGSVNGDDVADAGHLLAVMGKNLLRGVVQGEGAATAMAQPAGTPEVSAAMTAAQQTAFVTALAASVQKSARVSPDVTVAPGGMLDDGILSSLESVSSVAGVATKGAALPLVATVQPMTAQQSLAQAGMIAEKLAAQIVWMQSQHVQRAEINLNPAELGQLQIRLDIQRDQASVSVSSPHAHVREWLDAGQSRLRDLLSQTGVDLASYSVSDGLSQHSEHHQRRQGQDGSGTVASGLFAGDEIEVVTGEEGLSPLRMGVGLVDSYA